MASASRDDIIYIILLILGIAFGHFYRKIREIQQKLWIGTGFGLAIVLFCSGANSLHIFLSFLICCGVMKIFEAKSHLIIFAFMMTYLLFFRTVAYFGLPESSGHTNMIQMIMTLKIIGVAFEKNAVLTKSRETDKANSLTPVELAIKNIGVVDLIHYCFNYIGLLTGPYYTYRTFHDYFHLPFAVNAENSFKVTLDKLKFVPIYIGLFFVASSIWPLSYASTDEFYTHRSWLYRLFFVWPSFFIFRMRIYSGIILAECICTSAGFGAYPKELEARCGHGPSQAVTEEFLEKPGNREYNFETIENVNVHGVETCLTFREAMKHWNRCIQYWLAMYVYKRFPSKKYRVAATMAVSAYWHGVHAGYYFCILGPVFYLPIEDLYVKLLKFEEVTEAQQKLINAVKWILKFFAFSYMGTAFLLKDVKLIWAFYGSVYHFAYIFWAILYAACFYLWQQRRAAMKKAMKFEENSRKIEAEHIKSH